MLKKVLLIYNPKAGNGVFAIHLEKVVAAFAKKNILLVPFRLASKLKLSEMFSSHGVDEYYKIIAAGGDGTINLVVNEMIKNDIHVPLAIFPAGTANDLATNFEIPSTIEGMIKVALSDNYTKMDVGVAGGKYFVNVLAIGMLVDISQKTDPAIKNTMGIAAYYIKGLSELPKIKPTPIRITTDDYQLDANVSAVLVMNGRSAGGFKFVSPESKIGDGLLDIIVFREMQIPNMIPVLIQVLTGSHLEDKNIEYFKASRLTIESKAKKVNTDLDGERGDMLPLEVSILPNRLKIIIPEEKINSANEE